MFLISPGEVFHFLIKGFPVKVHQNRPLSIVCWGLFIGVHAKQSNLLVLICVKNLCVRTCVCVCVIILFTIL